MSLSELYAMNAVTVGASELSIVSGTTTLQTITTDAIAMLWLNPGNMGKGDVYKIRAYEKTSSTIGGKKPFFSASLMGVQSDDFITPSFLLMNGWDFTIQKIAGTDRAFTASIRAVT